MPWTLAGAEGPKRALGGMLASGRLPHAVLLTGPAGAGKFTLATDLAMAVNCEAPGAPGPPCGECVSCRKIREGIHPDVTVLAPRGRNARLPIDDVRAVRDALNFKPFEGRVKTALVRSADSFTEESGGALLKTLEEPTPDTLIVLTAVSSQAVMPTLVSRCVSFRIPPLPREAILRGLSERRGLSGAAAELLAGLSGGALGKALAIDPETALRLREGLEGVFSRPRGPLRLSRAMRLASEMAAEYDKLKAPKEDPDNASASGWLETAELSLRLWWRDAAVLGASGDAGLLDGPPPSRALAAFAGELEGDDLPAFEAACHRLVDGLGRFIRADLLFENFWSAVLE
ncbi:MAG: DNA polymerase III subunit [Deltaproteobacteria bacterium]|jgi:DNA polymerase III delta' subunit|nr:DNA polymerase III subunit [Deltaproteobacteria bacterium]